MTKEYSQTTNAATVAKWRRMCHNRGWAYTNYLECGFSSWHLDRSGERYKIVAVTNYHAESTLDEMYKHNFSNWEKSKIKF